LILFLPQNATCSNVKPVTKPGQVFACPDTTELNKNTLDAVPSVSSCCLVSHARPAYGQAGLAAAKLLMLQIASACNCC